MDDQFIFQINVSDFYEVIFIVGIRLTYCLSFVTVVDFDFPFMKESRNFIDHFCVSLLLIIVSILREDTVKEVPSI